MYIRLKTNVHRLSWLPVLIIALICSACGAGSGVITVRNVSPTHSVTVQPRPTVHLPAGPITYVALGASDAVGIGSNQPGSQGYVPLIATRLPKGSHSINLGIS